jgi:hypothetical protein
MGAYWLHDVDEWFISAGIPFRLYPGWETRSRSSGGFDDIRGLVAHHTVSTTTWQNDCAYMWQNAVTKPIGNFHLDREGIWTIGCAGASNTNGAGLADWHTTRGIIPIDPTSMGNRMAPAIEAANDGIGEEWPKVQADSYFEGMAVLCDHLGLEPVADVTTHRGWAGARKQDPYGPVEGYATLGTTYWSVPALRALVANALEPPEPPPTPEEPMTDDQMAELAELCAEATYERFKALDLNLTDPADPTKTVKGNFFQAVGWTWNRIRRLG